MITALLICTQQSLKEHFEYPGIIAASYIKQRLNSYLKVFIKELLFSDAELIFMLDRSALLVKSLCLLCLIFLRPYSIKSLPFLTGHDTRMHTIFEWQLLRV